MKLIAALLIAVGLVLIANGGLTFRTRETIVDAGPVQIEREKTNRVPFAPVAGGVVIAAGVAMLLAGRSSATRKS